MGSWCFTLVSTKSADIILSLRTQFYSSLISLVDILGVTLNRRLGLEFSDSDNIFFNILLAKMLIFLIPPYGISHVASILMMVSPRLFPELFPEDPSQEILDPTAICEAVSLLCSEFYEFSSFNFVDNFDYYELASCAGRKILENART